MRGTAALAAASMSFTVVVIALSPWTSGMEATPPDTLR
jgi:hypothetical protein